MGINPNITDRSLPNHGKVIIFTAPSGAGKSTIVSYLLERFPQLALSVSATTRPRRPDEKHGREYYYLSVEDFKEKVENEEFVEWEEVYHDTYYGTLRAELERLWKEERIVIFDVDVKGAFHLKQIFDTNALSVFVKPPSMEALEKRLKSRQTETPETLADRLKRAKMELTWENRFDRQLVNDDLGKALKDASQMVTDFIKAF